MKSGRKPNEDLKRLVLLVLEVLPVATVSSILQELKTRYNVIANWNTIKTYLEEFTKNPKLSVKKTILKKGKYDTVIYQIKK